MCGGQLTGGCTGLGYVCVFAFVCLPGQGAPEILRALAKWCKGMATALEASLAFPAAWWLSPETKHRICSFQWPQHVLPEVPTCPLGLEVNFQGHEN